MEVADFLAFCPWLPREKGGQLCHKPRRRWTVFAVGGKRIPPGRSGGVQDEEAIMLLGCTNLNSGPHWRFRPVFAEHLLPAQWLSELNLAEMRGFGRSNRTSAITGQARGGNSGLDRPKRNPAGACRRGSLVRGSMAIAEDACNGCEVKHEPLALWKTAVWYESRVPL